MLVKITWDLNGMNAQKAGVPPTWKIPIRLRHLSVPELKKYLTIKYCYNIKKIEIIYP